PPFPTRRSSDLPRILIYGALLLVLMAGFAWGIANRSPLIADVLRDRNALYRMTTDGVDNVYTLKLVNKSDSKQNYRVTLEAATAGIALRDGDLVVPVPAGEVASIPLEVGA